MTTFNTTLASTDNNYFDLMNYVGEIKMAYVAAQIASSTAWRLDTLLVSTSRQLLKGIKEEVYNLGGYESMNEVIAHLSEREFAEQMFIDNGGQLNGPIETIRALNAQRDQWHDLAARLVPMTSDYQGNPMTWDVPTIESEFHKDPALRVSEVATRRLKLRSERMAQALDMPELAQQHYENSIRRQEDANKRIASNLKDQAGLAHFMFQLVLKHDADSAATRSKAFYDLPIAAQRVLLDNAVGAAGRADERAAGDRNMSETEYDMISLTCIKTIKDLRTVISSRRFQQAQQAQQDQQTEQAS